MANLITPRNFLTQIDKRTSGAINRQVPVGMVTVTGIRYDGRPILKPLNGNCPVIGSSGDPTPRSIGDRAVVSRANSAEYSAPVTGGSGGGTSIISGGTSPYLIKQTPKLLEAPTSLFPLITPVVYTGYGFTANFAIEYLLLEMFWADPNIPEVHSSITVLDLVVVSSTEATANVSVTPDPQWAIDPLTLIPICGPVRWSA